MKLVLLAAVIVLPAFAHRLDEYLQGTILSVEKNRVNAQVTLIPGVTVFPTLIAEIDRDADGTISEAEQHAYAGRFLHDIAIAIDGHPLTPRLLSLQFPAIEEMREGRGEIDIAFDADLPVGAGNRKLTLENRHQSRIAAYQVNCLVSRDPDIRLVAQHRNYSQSSYALEFVESGEALTRSSTWTLLGMAALLLVTGWCRWQCGSRLR
jgi:hypothetical protein